MIAYRSLIKKIFGLLFIWPFCCLDANSSKLEVANADQASVIATVKKAENYIKINGIKEAIIKFKHSKDIFIGNYDGMFFISPVHPELIGKNQFNYKDSTGTLVVQEEINKAKEGGGWLKGHWRINPQTGKYQCRKIYIRPVADNYFVGSWYYYSDKQGNCSF